MDPGFPGAVPWRREMLRGPWTGARRPKEPVTYRPYGHNTRRTILGDRSAITGMRQHGYAKEIVESRPVPPLFPSSGPCGQSGAPSVLSSIPALRPGPQHMLFG